MYQDYNNNANEEVSSPQTEHLLFNFLRPQMERQHEKSENNNNNQLVVCHQNQIKREESTLLWDNTFMTVEEECNIVIELNSFADLQVAFKDIEELEPNSSSSSKTQLLKTNGWSTTEEDLINFSDISVPPAIRLNVESSQMLDLLMNRAVQHWCCIGFKVAPISVNLIHNWRRAPRAIVYCVASICLVTFMDQQVQNNALYFKQAAMAFYEQARNKLDDILLDDMQPLIIQSYFCLSYTSNLLRLYEQQRTWGSLASISLQHLASTEPKDDLIMGCWLRWYYVDAWMCLTLNRDCLLPDEVPWIDVKHIEQLSLARLSPDKHNLYSFAMLTYYMRRYIRALNSGKLFTIHQQQRSSSSYYYEITRQLTTWYSKLPRYNTTDDLHLRLCYHSVRLVVLYQFLHPQSLPAQDILIDCLETNLQLLQALQHLKTLGCDQSTYHHMFFAIHNTAKRIFQYKHEHTKHLHRFASEQLKINLMLLKSTQAYAHDVFKMKIYAQKIQDQFTRMNLTLEQDTETTPVSMHPLQQQQSNIIVFRQDNDLSIKKRKKH